MCSHIGPIISEEAVSRRGNCDLPKVMQEDKQRAVQNKEDFGVGHICLESHEQVMHVLSFLNLIGVVVLLLQSWYENEEKCLVHSRC